MALDGHKDMATNSGFRMKDGAMYTHEQHKLGLSAYYDKRWVLEDGIHTEPIEFHTNNEIKRNPLTYQTIRGGRRGIMTTSLKCI